MSKRKGLKSRYFALISLRSDSPFNFTFKDMHNMSNIQTVLFWKNVYLRDSGSWSVSYTHELRSTIRFYQLPIRFYQHTTKIHQLSSRFHQLTAKFCSKLATRLVANSLQGFINLRQSVINPQFSTTHDKFSYTYDKISEKT